VTSLSSRKRKQERKTDINTNLRVTNKVKPRTKNQRELLKSIYNNDITFAVGCAGTGKTCLSVGTAVDLIQRRKVNRIIITRPIIEAGQNRNHNKSAIGYLPGDVNAKMAPFLRPVYDELLKFLTPDAIQVMRNNNVLEVCPLEHMRGRTFENSFILLDEAQNATEEQIEMLLTRLGNNSKMVLVGDIDQSDLPSNLEGGFANFIDDIEGLDGLEIVYLESIDIQRHPIVKLIIERRKQVLQELSEPASLERIKYENRINPSKNVSVECKHDANSSDTLD
jgi:phosphate starvation-inducible PhoH-like protein